MKNLIVLISIALLIHAAFSTKYTVLENLSINEEEFDKSVKIYKNDLNTFESLVLKSLNSKYNNYIRNLINAYENEKDNIDMTVLLSMAGPKTQNKCNSTASNTDDAIYSQTKVGLEKCLQYFIADLEYNLSVERSLESQFPQIKKVLKICSQVNKSTWSKCFGLVRQRHNITMESGKILNNPTDVQRSVEKSFDECSMSYYVAFTETIAKAYLDLRSCITPPLNRTLLKQFRQ